MVGSRDIIADRFGGVAAQKHRAGMPHLREQFGRIGGRDFQMLGCDAIDQWGAPAISPTRMIAP